MNTTSEPSQFITINYNQPQISNNTNFYGQNFKNLQTPMDTSMNSGKWASGGFGNQTNYDMN